MPMPMIICRLCIDVERLGLVRGQDNGDSSDVIEAAVRVDLEKGVYEGIRLSFFLSLNDFSLSRNDLFLSPLA